MWFWLALLAAFLGAFETLINKKILRNVRPILMSWSAFALPIPILIFFVLINGVSNINIFFFIGTIGSSIIFSFVKVMKNKSMKNSDLSKIIPLASFGSFFTYLLGAIFLSEHISLIGLLGLVLIMTATYILNIEKAREHILEPIKILIHDPDSFIYLVAMLLSSVVTVFDKTALNNSFPANAAMVLLAENIFMTTILTVLLIKEKGWVSDLRNNIWSLSIYSTLYTIVSLLVFVGFAGGPVALVQGVKKFEMLFVLMLGYFFLNDKPPKHTWLATGLMILGIVLIKLA